MRRATRANPGQLVLPGLAAQPDLPGLLTTEPAPPLPDPRRAHACARCGWYREPTGTCPVCQHAPTRR